MWYSRVNNASRNTYVRETPSGDIPAGVTSNPAQNDTSNTLIGHCHSGHCSRDCIPTGELFINEYTWPTTVDTSYHRPRQRLRGRCADTGQDGRDADGAGGFQQHKDASYETPPFANAIRVMMRGRFVPSVTDIKVMPSVVRRNVWLGESAFLLGPRRRTVGCPRHRL
ncbi:hypothetical protein QF000_000166 [Paraburkholderia atlantica]|uniref:X-Pro dipeptidyl-peptidase n=1 Tax=Paraburkholderia youngii TaxID=2782701 RepID=A0A7W8LFH6_9BURK|nr:hypothetical protein [Paraburkholderia youngii]MBB5406040.1 X-Pro dipeptidyl-peptidase [Paraburkholderia youngii]